VVSVTMQSMYWLSGEDGGIVKLNAVSQFDAVFSCISHLGILVRCAFVFPLIFYMHSFPPPLLEIY
jgi:hypothetical protein